MYTLITAATSAGAYQLKSKIGGENILLGDYAELPEILVSSHNMIRLPDPSDASYVHKMLALCLDRNITALYALRDAENKLLMESKQLFSEYGIHIFAL
ncbi:MAG: hypothetical protein JST19_15125 [Bacteroidetes bacterium]|nr:hypothetical protein [Bacteroidota bacterium]